MKVTICELSDDRKDFEREWAELTDFLEKEATDLLLLPEMPFSKWMAHDPHPNENLKKAVASEHRNYLSQFENLNSRYILYSAPEWEDGRLYNTALLWHRENGQQQVHRKQIFPEEPHFYEESWFAADGSGWEVMDAGGFKIGVLLCTEMWFTEHARNYGKSGIDLLLCPRATGLSSLEQWVRCGQTLAVISGAFCLSANRSGKGSNSFSWGGTSFIAQPGDGSLLAKTSAKIPFITISIDLEKARSAKREYPLYVNP